MRAAHAHIVLAIGDAGLRSILAAQLSLAGELVISTADHLDPGLNRTLRATALLVIEQYLVRPIALDWAEALRNQHWSGDVIVIIDENHNLLHDDETIYLVDRRTAVLEIVALARLRRLQRDESLNRLR